MVQIIMQRETARLKCHIVVYIVKANLRRHASQKTNSVEAIREVGFGNVSVFRMIVSTVSAVYPYLVTFFVVNVQFKFG